MMLYMWVQGFEDLAVFIFGVKVAEEGFCY